MFISDTESTDQEAIRTNECFIPQSSRAAHSAAPSRTRSGRERRPEFFSDRLLDRHEHGAEGSVDSILRHSKTSPTTVALSISDVFA
jgi:hypothetical protein